MVLFNRMREKDILLGKNVLSTLFKFLMDNCLQSTCYQGRNQNLLIHFKWNFLPKFTVEKLVTSNYFYKKFYLGFLTGF